MKFLPLLLMAFGAMTIGCERHSFEDTRELHNKPERPTTVDPADQGDADAEH